MSERRLNQEQEKVLRAIYKKNNTTAGLKASLKLTHKKYQTIIGFLLKHKYIKRTGRGVYKVLPLGEGYITTYLEPALVVSFGDSKVKEFLTEFPEPYRGVMRLAVSSYIAKQSKIFDQKDFDGAFPATILVGEPGIGKTPIGEAVCRLQGLKFKDHKLNVEAINKGEFGGRWAQKKGGKWEYNLSYWFGLGYLQIEEPESIVNREVSNLVRFILHGDKTYKKDIDYENRVVPFLTLNLPRGKKAQTIMEKVNSVKGLEVATIKRNVTLFCNPYRGYLGDPYKFFGRVMKDIPTIDLNFSVVKFFLAPKEKDLLIRLIHKAMKSEFEFPFCDKRGVEIQVLGYHALSGNKDITSVIYQVVKDRLQVLESLGLVRPGWRSWYDREWVEYVAVANPEKAGEIREAIKRQEELEASIPRIDLPWGIHKGKVELAERHSDMLDKLREMRDFLDFPLTRIKGIKEAKISQEKLKELCRRYKRNHKGLRNKVVIEITTLKEATKDNVRIGNLMVDDLSKQVQVVRSGFISDIQRLMRPVVVDDPERRETAKNEMIFLRAKLNQNDLMSVKKGELNRILQADQRAQIGRKHRHIRMGTGKGSCELIIKAIQNLRASTSDLSNWLAIRIKRPKKDYPLRELENDLATAKRQASPWLTKFEKDMDFYTGKTGIRERLSGGDEKRPEKEYPDDDIGLPPGGIEGHNL